MGRRAAKLNPERKRVLFSRKFRLEAVNLLELGQKTATQLMLESGVARNFANRSVAGVTDHPRFDPFSIEGARTGPSTATRRSNSGNRQAMCG